MIKRVEVEKFECEHGDMLAEIQFKAAVLPGATRNIMIDAAVFFLDKGEKILPVGAFVCAEEICDPVSPPQDTSIRYEIERRGESVRGFIIYDTFDDEVT